MEGVYEYLIGGKKIGKKGIPTFNELGEGDTLYVYKCMSAKECIQKLKIVAAYKTTEMIEYVFKDDRHYYIPLVEGSKSFHININYSHTKIFFATTEEELRKHITDQNIKVENK